ncbi:MAG: hypothetical protein AB7N76_21130 [Planctomycetota bacterium]
MSETELSPLEQHEQEFLATPDAAALVKLHAYLLGELLDERLAGVLDKIRPIQHRVTLIQADASGPLLEALCRDPHKDVRKVVAGHASITEEVCFRLCEDPEHIVRLALRKNAACHPVIRAALVLRERGGDEHRIRADHLLEISWQARRAGLAAPALVELFEEWAEAGPDDLPDLDAERANRVLDVLNAHLGKGSMPKKPRKAAVKKKTTKKKAAKKKARKK